MKTSMQKLFIGALILLISNGCIVTSNYYTGRTLEEKKFALTLCADDIIFKENNPSLKMHKKWPLAPSVMLSYGLPFRLETTLHCAPPGYAEGGLRYQVNPRSFDLMDCSVNMHYSYVIDEYSYLKYGITVSKMISNIEPYVHYSMYHFMHTQENNEEDFVLEITKDFTKEFINISRSVGFGIGIPIKNGMLFPEVNYEYRSAKNGFFHFGIGIRASRNKLKR